MITINRINQSYGRLKVVSLLYETSSDVYWNCLCSCGKNITIREASLKSGTNSCGCLKVETERRKKEFQESVTKKAEPVTKDQLETVKISWYKQVKVNWVQTITLLLALTLIVSHIFKTTSLQNNSSVLESSVKSKTFSRDKK